LTNDSIADHSDTGCVLEGQEEVTKVISAECPELKHISGTIQHAQL
jgi:hypothetical protein